MRIICRSLLDNSVALSQKNTLLYYLHELNHEYGRARDTLPRAAQFEILQSLLDLCKALDAQLHQTLQYIKDYEACKGQMTEEPPKIFEIGEKSLIQKS